VAHAEEVPLLASRITDALYSRLEKGRATQLTVIHAVPAPSASIEIVERALLPFDFARFKVAPRSIPPITTLPPEQLLAELAEEYVYAELCEEVMLSFAAENEARMQAMIAARSNVARKLDELVESFRRLRQEEITGEIIELSAGSVSAAGSVKRKRDRASVLSR
jgi:F-type H+-transporting ATPase subunit gamma